MLMLWPELPHPRELAPWLAKMEANPGSCLILTIEAHDEEGKRPHVRWAWVSEAERKAIKRAMIAASIERGKRGKPHFTDPP